MPGYARPRKTKNGTKRWQARWRPPGDGRDTERRTETFRLKSEADGWIDDLDADHKAGRHVDPRKGDKAFSDVAAEWLATKQHLEPRTCSDYEATLITWYTSERDPLNRRPPFNRRIAAIGAPQIESWLEGFQPARSHRTMVKVYGLLGGKRGIMAFAVQKGYIPFNPSLNVAIPPAPKAGYDPTTGEFIEDEPPGIATLERAEIAKLAAAMPTDAYRTAVHFDAWMGLRAGELWALKRKDVNEVTGQVHVRRAWKEVNGKHRGEAKRYFLGPVKTKAGKRDIQMPPTDVKQPLLAYLDRHPEIGPDDFLFTTGEGQPVRQSSFYKKVFKPAVKSVLPQKSHLRFHDLRHTAASFILAVHPNLFLVMQRLGHASIDTTTKTYGHLVGDVDAMLATALDEFAAQPVTQTTHQLREVR